MKIVPILLAITLTGFLAAALAEGPQKQDLKAVYNLSGVLQSLDNKELVVSFSDDMLPLGGKRDGNALVGITPAIKGEFTWRGNRTLAFRPETRFRYSTTYTAVIPAGTKSLSGKVLPKEIRWQWSTPQAFPVEIKAGPRDYFSRLEAGDKIDQEIWVKDPIILRFNQPVAAAGARKFFVLKEAKSGESAAIQISQKESAELEIRFPGNLKRGLLYQFTVQRGFCGSEGSTGTNKDFTFTFGTVPSFRYAGRRPVIIFQDEPYFWLLFSNALRELDPGLVRVFKGSGKERIPLAIHLEPRHYENQALFIRIDDPLASGERLTVQVERSLANIYGERLPESLIIEADVCSSRSPFIDFSLQGKKFSATVKSVKQAGIRLFKLKTDFYGRLEDRDFGILQQKGFQELFVEKEIQQELEGLPEATNNPALNVDELGSPLGFFAFLVQRCEPYNACKDIALLRLPALRPLELQVFHRRNMDMIVKAGQGQTLYWLYDNRTGKGLGNMPFFLKEYGQETLSLGHSADSGVLLSDREIQESSLVMARNEGDMALARIDRRPQSDREVRITVFSERDFYKPGDVVHIAGLVKEYASGRISSPKATSALLEILGPDQQKVKSDTLPLDRLGGFHYEFTSDAAGKKGRFQILVKVSDVQLWQGRRTVTIDYYQPNTFELTISGVAERYRFNDTFCPLVSGSYLAGNPMAGDRFEHALFVTPAAGDVFSTAALKEYRFGLDWRLARNDPPKKGEQRLDAAGKCTLGISMSYFPQANFLAELAFSATGKSAEGKEFTARARSVYFPGDLLTGIRVDRYQSLKEKVNAELALVDFQGKPAAGEIRISLYQDDDGANHGKLIKVAGPFDVYVDKIKTYSFHVPKAGSYVLRCDTPDADGRVVSTSMNFFAWDSDYAGDNDRLRIESDQETLRSGETLKLFIRSPRAARALVTIERGKVLDFRVIDLQKTTPLEIAVKKEYFPAVHVGVIAMYEDNNSEETSRDFQVVDQDKTLRVDLESPVEIKPASKGMLKVRVQDARNNGARAKLFVYAVDEGNLSLQAYRMPDPLRYFYYYNPLGSNHISTYYSKYYSHWTFERPMMDIHLPEPAIFGCVYRPDATPIAGATVTLEDEKHKMLQSTTASAQGYYSFSGMPSGRYAVKAEAKGFHPFISSDVYFDGGNHRPCDLALIPASMDKYWAPSDEFLGQGGSAGGIAPAPMASEMMSMTRQKKDGADDGGLVGGIEKAIAGIRVRSDFKEVLFFKTAETDEAGMAAIEFESSDQLSTYRIMAVAYSDDSFGVAEKKIVVSKDLLISEAFPEFARQGDEFSAGVQVSNRTAQKLSFTLLAKPQGLAIRGGAQIENTLDARSNGLFRFPFLAERIGEAKLEFFALSAADKDGLEKKLPVTDRLISETLLDFVSGKSVKKAIQPQAEGEQQSISIKVTPSLLRPAARIASTLVFYPYECLEQRTSKVMPFLALSPALAERLDLGLDRKQIREAIAGYLKIVPEFMGADGSLSYYRGGQYASDYLTAYVLWALHLARENDYQVDPQLLDKIAGYLQRADLDKTCASFYQFVLSLHKQADKKKLAMLAGERGSLPLPARVFLYRALHNQGIKAEVLPDMLAEFNNSLQVEADFAYFDAGEFAYHRDFPFYSSRFATALLLQAVLEVEGEHVLAERIINWLLEGDTPDCWNTTQTNFWILSAMDEYLKKVEKTTARRAEISLLGENAAKEFAGSRDTLVLSRKLDNLKEQVQATVQADQPVYVTSELTWKLSKAGKKSRGIDIQRNVYNEKGEMAKGFQRGQIYMVELLVKSDKEVPYGVIDEPLAAGFELLRQDIASSRTLKEFNTRNSTKYRTPWARQENAADRLVFYTYSMQGPLRIVYFIKAMYSGRFTWMPAVALGMYHPQYFGRTAIQTVEVSE